MNLLPRSREEFAQTDYWNEFFKKRGNEAFEWYVCTCEYAKHIHSPFAGSARVVIQANVSIYYVNYGYVAPFPIFMQTHFQTKIISHILLEKLSASRKV